MRLYLISPIGVPVNPHLFPMWVDTFVSSGHEIVGSIKECDVVLFDFHTRISGYDQSDIDWILQSNIPIVTFDEWDRGNMSNDEWPYPLTAQQESIYLFSYTVKSVHFCRLMDKTKKYPFNVFPYEKPTIYEEPVVSADELFGREIDVCFIANYSPSRDKIAEAFSNDGRFKFYGIIGGRKLPFDEFIHLHKRAKLFISSGAGGFTDERKQNLFSIAGIIQERTDQLLLHPFTNLVNCIKIESHPTRDDLDTIFEIVSNKDRLYEIYSNGAAFMKSFYSKEYIAKYILETINKHINV